ncbi:MAG TPA: Sapep family Mn(2+)-dependent dipeptidase [Candidatus Sumerlaeia bacterium]|nr:Sapep family Mn(2+)-dependent dipeptidase [Candidatus Sumerlaeia bacterium]
MPKLCKSFQERLFAEIENLKDDLVRETSRIISFETISGGKSDAEKEKFNREIARNLDYLKDFAERHGFVYKDLDGIVSVIEQPAETKEKGLGVPLHIDVVPVSGEWKYPPFSGTVADGCIWGRGTQDDKGPLMACLFGLIALKKLGVRFIRPIHIVLGRGEEVGEWSDVQYFLKKEGAPAFSFTPDAAFPIINGEKGIMNLKINAEWESADAGKSLHFHSLSGGNRANVVPDEAIVRFTTDGDEAEAMKRLKKELDDFSAQNKEAKIRGPEICEASETSPRSIKITFLGKSAHGSLPQDGHNAILDALQFLKEHDSLSPDCRAYAAFLHGACSQFFGGGLNIAVEHHFVGKTTVNLGICNMNEKEGRAVINIRPTLGLLCREVGARASALAKAESEKTGCRIYVEDTKEWGRDALYVDPKENAFFISSLQEAYRTVTGGEPELKAIGGTTFAKAYPNCVCFGPVGADEKDLAHITDEYVKISRHVENTKIYAAAFALLTTDAACV